jgi:ABC-type nitrate/sulfonate/bicarbonate transport system substrate-binding protein
MTDHRTPFRSGRAAAAAAAVLALAVTACGGAAEPASSSTGADVLRVAYVPVGTLLPAFVAEDTGIFDRNGLDVTLVPIQNVSTIPGALGRQFEIGSSTPPDLIKAAAQGLGTAAVTSATVDTEANPIGQIVVPADSPVRTVADLAGRRVAAPSVGATMHVSLLNWLQQEGVDPSSVAAVETPFPTMGDQLAAGRVDAVEAVEPFLSLLLAAGNRSIGSPILTIGEPPVVSVLWIAQWEWAQQNPDVVERWNASLAEAEQLITTDGSRARQILQAYTQLPDALASSSPLPTYSASTAPTELEAQLGPWTEALRRAGQLTGDVPTDRLVVGTAGP